MLRFRLRGLLLLIMALAVLLGWWERSARIQRRARSAMEGAEAWANYTYQYSQMGGPVSDAKPLAPAWLRALLGDEYFTSIRAVYARLSMLSDESLVALAALPDLVSISTNHEWMGSFIGTLIISPDQGRQHGEYLDGSRQQFAAKRRITDEGIAHLAICDSL